MKSKGYPSDKCWGHCAGGFLLGIIWLIVVLCKKPYDGTGETPLPNGSPESKNTMEQLGKLAQLRNSGVITETEFEEKKKELLNRI